MVKSNAEEKRSLYVKMLKDELEKKNVKVDEKVLEESMKNAFGKIKQVDETCHNICVAEHPW